MGEDVAAKGVVGRVAAFDLVAPSGAVWFEQVNIHHNGVSLLCGLAELGRTSLLRGGGTAGGCGIDRGITAVGALTVTISGAMTLGDFAG